MPARWQNRGEIQTYIDECADGTWQGQIYVGSIVFVPPGQDHTYVNGATFLEVAEKMARIIEALDA